MLDELLRETKAALPLDLTRWSIEPETYWKEVAAIRRFVRERPGLVRSYLGQALGLPVAYCSGPDGVADRISTP